MDQQISSRLHIIKAQHVFVLLLPSDCHSVLCIPVDETFRFKNKTPPSDSIALRKPCCCASIAGNRLLSSVSSFTIYLYNIHSLLILGVGKGKI